MQLPYRAIDTNDDYIVGIGWSASIWLQIPMVTRTYYIHCIGRYRYEYSVSGVQYRWDVFMRLQLAPAIRRSLLALNKDNKRLIMDVVVYNCYYLPSYKLVARTCTYLIICKFLKAMQLDVE